MGSVEVPEYTWADRMRMAADHTKDFRSRVILYVIFGIGIGAMIHGHVPIDLVAKYAGRETPLRFRWQS